MGDDITIDYAEEEEDKIIAESPILRRLIELALKEPISKDWERELDEL